MSSITVEAEFSDLAKTKSSNGFIELPLHVLKEQYKYAQGGPGKAFLDKIIAASACES